MPIRELLKLLKNKSVKKEAGERNVNPPLHFPVRDRLLSGDLAASFAGGVDLVEMTFFVDLLQTQCDQQFAASAQECVVWEAIDKPPDVDGRVVDDADVVLLLYDGAVGQDNTVVFFQAVSASAERGELDRHSVQLVTEYLVDLPKSLTSSDNN